MEVEINIFDSKSHAVALYFTDYDRLNRKQLIEILDNNGSFAYSYLVQDFPNGTYLLLNLQGWARIRITRRDGGNAVLSGIFFDPGPSPATSKAPPVPPILGNPGASSGQFVFTSPVIIDSRLCVDHSNDLRSWLCLATNTANSEVFTFQAPMHLNGFFRLHHVE
jgi:hypothetical protein